MALITAEEARHHPRRNIITRTVGGDLLLRPDFRSEPVEAGDIFVLCTDGLWDPVDEAEIVATTTDYAAAEACRYLVDLALARGADDNISIQMVKVLALGPQTAGHGGRGNGLLKRAFRFLGNQEQGAARGGARP
jgi:serine/threonine protein phosphatase PrpC